MQGGPRGVVLGGTGIIPEGLICGVQEGPLGPSWRMGGPGSGSMH